MRPGIAYDQCGSINWNTHQRWVQQLLNLSSKNTPDGYSKIRTDQLVRADRELFTLMAETLQISGEELTDTPPPMDVCMQKLSTDVRVTMHLLPLPKALKATSDDSGAALRRSTPTADPPVRNPKVKIKKPSAKAKNLCPEELKYYKSQDSEGNNICWSYNVKNGCQLETKDGKCQKGYHKCMKCHRLGHSLPSRRSNQK